MNSISICRVNAVLLFGLLSAVLKIFLDHIPRLHPYAFLLGEEGEGDQGPGLVDKIRSWLKKF